MEADYSNFDISEQVLDASDECTSLPPQNGGTRNQRALSSEKDLPFCSLFLDIGFNALLCHTDVERIKQKQGLDQSNHFRLQTEL